MYFNKGTEDPEAKKKGRTLQYDLKRFTLTE